MEENTTPKAKIHIISDVDCEVYMFGKHLCSLKAGEGQEVPMLKGNKKITAVSKENPEVKVELTYMVTSTDIEDFIEIKLERVRRTKEKVLSRKKYTKKALKIFLFAIVPLLILIYLSIFIIDRFFISEISEPSGSHNGHEYVDLGLSVKWATCNVGADSPEEYGDYFAWGETSPQEECSPSTYKYNYGDKYLLTKYCTDSSYGTVDNKTTLELLDDAAYVNWGGKWRMPTAEEIDELIDTNNCTLTWIERRGVNGYKVKSKKNGNSIFLPAAGCRFDGSLYNACRGGDYWSSSLSTDASNFAYFFSFPFVRCDINNRCYGFSVRPVCE